MKGDNGSALIFNGLQDLEGKLKDATPLDLPKVFAVHMDLFSLGLDILDRRSGGYRTYGVRKEVNEPNSIRYHTERLQEIEENMLSKDVKGNIKNAFDSQIRLAWNIPAEEVNAFNRGPYKLVSYDENQGVCVAVAVQYYKQL